MVDVHFPFDSFLSTPNPDSGFQVQVELEFTGSAPELWGRAKCGLVIAARGKGGRDEGMRGRGTRQRMEAHS